MSLPNPHPERLLKRHPHRRRLPRHARHLVRQMLRPRVAMRAGTLQTHVRQLDSAVNIAERPDRVHPDHDRHAPGVRVLVGPETRSLLRQLLDSRDLRVQQQLVREIVHQVQKRTLAALRRAARMEKARELASRAAGAAKRAGGKAVTTARAGRHWVVTRTAGRTGPAPVTRSRAGFGTVPARSRTADRATRKPRKRVTRTRGTRA